MKTRSQGPASPLPDVTTKRKRNVTRAADLPLMTRYGFVWPKYDYRGYKAPTTEESVDDFIHNFIVLAEGNAIYIPNGYGCVMFTALCSTGFVFWTWYKQTQAKREIRARNLFMRNPNGFNFNGIFQAYRSTFELHSRFLFHLIFSGLEWPMMSTVAGMSWIIARFFYVKACHRGEAEVGHWCWIDWLSFNFVRVGAIYYAFKRLL